MRVEPAKHGLIGGGASSTSRSNAALSASMPRGSSRGSGPVRNARDPRPARSSKYVLLERGDAETLLQFLELCSSPAPNLVRSLRQALRDD